MTYLMNGTERMEILRMSIYKEKREKQEKKQRNEPKRREKKKIPYFIVSRELIPMSIATLNRKTKEKYHTGSIGKQQFSINGTHRNQGWIGQTSLARSTNYTNNFSNSNTIIKPSVLNAAMVMNQKTIIKPFNIVKPNRSMHQSEHTTARQRFSLNEISKLPVLKPILVGKKCFTTKKIGTITYGEHLFLLTKGCS